MADNPETLNQLLKEKAKELKLAQKKLAKVEDKFVETHKENKALGRDRDTLISFLQFVFEDHKQILEELASLSTGPENYGLFDLTQLQDFYQFVLTAHEKASIQKQDEIQTRLDEQTALASKVPELQKALESVETELRETIADLEIKVEMATQQAIDLQADLDSSVRKLKFE